MVCICSARVVLPVEPQQARAACRISARGRGRELWCPAPVAGLIRRERAGGVFVGGCVCVLEWSAGWWPRAVPTAASKGPFKAYIFVPGLAGELDASCLIE